MTKIRVLVVDDSAFMRKIITDMINEHENIEVIGTAKNGKEAILKIKSLKPDVVTLDIEMPIMDGLTALKEIMSFNPVPVLMLSSLTMEGADATINALQFGAVDFITKPMSILKINAEDMKKQLHEKILIASNVRIQQNITNKTFSSIRNRAREKKSCINNNKGKIKKIVAIGTSTGGPRALQTLLSDIPKDIDASFVIVQHMPPGFTKSLAQRLDSISNITVKEGEQNDILLPGHAYIAPGDFHMRIIKEKGNYKIVLNKNSPVSGHRPSVDVLFNSIAELGISNVIGIILTGMGSDGAKALKGIKDNSGYVIAQNEESCVVFGMPKAAITLGIVDKILSIEDIGKEIISIIGG